MHQVDTLLMSADPVQKLHLTQERIDLHAEHLRLTSNTTGEFADLERSFVRVARSYGDRHGLTYSAWRQIGVDADVLAKAGIKQAAKPARPAPTAEAEPKKYKAVAKKPAAEAAAAPLVVEAAPLVEAPPVVEEAPVNKAPAKKATATKKQPTKAKAAAAKNGASPRPAKKAAAKPSPSPEQQQLPAEAHLLS
ncbi:MAG: hypothetical protein QOF21_1612 [Actinomycetota bacterium]|jgi:hypothetical protein